MLWNKFCLKLCADEVSKSIKFVLFTTVTSNVIQAEVLDGIMILRKGLSILYPHWQLSSWAPISYQNK